MPRPELLALERPPASWTEDGGPDRGSSAKLEFDVGGACDLQGLDGRSGMVIPSRQRVPFRSILLDWVVVW